MSVANGSQALDRAAALLATVVESERPRTFTSLVEEIGLAKSTTSRLLTSLERNRLLQRDRHGAFRAGSLFVSYATQHDPALGLVALAEPVLERLGQQTGETVNLAVPGAGDVVNVSQVDGSYLLGATNWVGVSAPAHCSALGKVFFAWDALDLPEGPLERPTAYSIASLSALRKDLAEARRRGWTISWDELEIGLVAIAVPVRHRDGSVVAALSVSGPTARITRPDVTRVADRLVAEARSLSALLGHRPDKEGAA